MFCAGLTTFTGCQVPNKPLYQSLEGRDGIQRDLDSLERWTCVNLMKFYKARCKVLYMGWSNPKHKYSLGGEWI